MINDQISQDLSAYKPKKKNSKQHDGSGSMFIHGQLLPGKTVRTLLVKGMKCNNNIIK